MTDVLKVAKRSDLGSQSCRRLRRTGQIPAVLYGHGQENVNLAVAGAELESVVRAGHKVVDLGGDLQEKALINQVQWDALGNHVLHADLTRVSAEERVVVPVAVALKGEAPGSKSGGMVEQNVHEIEVEAPATMIPDRIVVDISHLELGSHVSASEVSLPDGVTLACDAQLALAQCVAKGVELEGEEEEGVAPGAAEPEVIGRKPDEEDDS